MRLIDDRTPEASTILKDLFPHTGRATIIGVTGNPGSGKSTLVDRLIEVFRKENKSVGVIAVDPSSPYTGGAILGDRIRMQRHATDDGVFIRSVATRGHMGGLSRSARDLVRVLDAFGCDVILVETVGVGQDELEITRTAHTTLVVMAPGLGDEVQAIKAGLMEVADVFAVNKADKDGADSTVRDVELMIALGHDSMIALGKTRGHTVHGSTAGLGGSSQTNDEVWTPPIQKCVSTRGEGIAALAVLLAMHKAWIDNTEAGRARKHARLADELRESLREALIEAATTALATEINEAVASVERREVDPYTATELLIQRFLEKG